MAGVVPFPDCTLGRKQWNIRDRKSVKRFRNQLAEDGCPESQLVLAKQLLQEKNVVNIADNDENARLGVFWLIKASEQGNVEATNILKKCFESGEGITEHNYLDVKNCLSTSQNEKLARRAARELFFSLSAGQDFITSEQLRQRMRKLSVCGSGDSKPRDLCEQGDDVDKSCQNGGSDVSHSVKEDDAFCDNEDQSAGWSLKSESLGEKLTEDHLENAASTYARGELPLVQRVLTLTDPRNQEMNSLNYLQRAVLHPLRTIQESYLRLLDHFTSRSQFCSIFPFSYYHIQILLILIFYPMINMYNILVLAPMFIYYVSFFAMILSTLQMLNSKKEYSNFRVWSRLFLSYDRDGSLNTGDAEFEYCKKNLRPFIVYFVSLLVNLLSYPFISEMWIPESEFAIIAFALTFVTLYFFHEKVSSRKLDFLVLFSFGINVLAKYPYETDGVVRQTWRFLDIELPTLQSYGLPCFASQIVGNGVEFCLNFRGFFYLLMPAIFAKMASRENWRGTYKILIPHCVTLSWWQIAVLCCQGATLYGLIRSTLALVGLIFFLPIVGVATIVLPIIAALKHFTDITLSPKTGVTTVLAAIPLFLGYFMEKRRGLPLRRYLGKVQMILAVISAFFLLCPSVNDLLSETPGETEIQVQPVLTWDQYSSICGKAAWNKRTVAEIQQDCLHFSGLTVNWEGTVEDVRIVKITNTFLKIVDYLPQSIRSKLMCLYGERFDEGCRDQSGENPELCQVFKQFYPNKKCHVKSWDKYEFEIKLKMKSSVWNRPESTINLESDDNFRNFTLNLRVNDQLWFSGALHRPETLGSERLTVAVDEIGCISCENKILTSLKRPKSKFSSCNLLKEVHNGFKRILNFIFNPVLIFR